jgi:hypothetical protein
VDQENIGLRARLEELEGQVVLARDEVTRQHSAIQALVAEAWRLQEARS